MRLTGLRLLMVPGEVSGVKIGAKAVGRVIGNSLPSHQLMYSPLCKKLLLRNARMRI